MYSFILHICVYVLLDVCAPKGCSVQETPEKGARSQELEFYALKLLECWKPDTGPLGEQQVLLTAKTLLQPYPAQSAFNWPFIFQKRSSDYDIFLEEVQQ